MKEVTARGSQDSVWSVSLRVYSTLTAGVRLCCSWRGACRLRFGICDDRGFVALGRMDDEVFRKNNLEGAALVDFAIHNQFRVMPDHNVLGNGQAQAGAA